MEAAHRRHRGQCVAHVGPCTYEVQDDKNGACGPDLFAQAMTDWLEKYGHRAFDFALQTLEVCDWPTNGSQDLQDWFSGNPSGFGLARILAIAEEWGTPIPRCASMRMRDLRAFLDGCVEDYRWEVVTG